MRPGVLRRGAADLASMIEQSFKDGTLCVQRCLSLSSNFDAPRRAEPWGLFKYLKLREGVVNVVHSALSEFESECRPTPRARSLPSDRSEVICIVHFSRKTTA